MKNKIDKAGDFFAKASNSTSPKKVSKNKKKRKVSAKKNEKKKKTIRKQEIKQKVVTKKRKKTTENAVVSQKNTKRKQKVKATNKKTAKIAVLKTKTNTTVKKTVTERSGKLNIIWTALLIGLIPAVILITPKTTFQGISFSKTIIAICIIFALTVWAIVGSLRNRKVSNKRNLFTKYISLFVVLYIISTIFSVDFRHSLTGFGLSPNPATGLFPMLALAMLFFFLLNKASFFTIRKLYKGLVLTVGLMVIYVFLLNFGLIPQALIAILPPALTGTFVGVSILLSLGLPLLLVSIVLIDNNIIKTTKPALIKSILSILSFIATYDLLVLRGYVSWFGILSGLIVLFFLLLGSGVIKNISGFFKVVAWSIFLILLIVTGLIKSGYENFLPQVTKVSLPTELKVGLPISYDIIRNILAVGDLKEILIGSGPTTYGYDFAKYHSGQFATTTATTYMYKGDGFFGEALPTIGVLGFVVGLFLIILFLKNGWNSLGANNSKEGYFIALFSASVVWLFNFMFQQQDAGTILFGGLLLGMTAIFINDNFKTDKTRQKDKSFIFNGFWGLIILLLSGGMALTGLVLSVRSYLSDLYALQSQQSQDLADQEMYINKALQVNPKEGLYLLKKESIELTRYIDLKKSAKKDDDAIEQVKSRIRQNAQEIYQLMPNDISTMHFLVQTYLTIGDVEKAKEIYHRIFELEPNNVKYYLEMGNLYLQEKDNPESVRKALGYYLKALSVNSEISTTYYKLAEAYSRLGEVDKALQSIAVALKMQPNNASYKFLFGILLQQRGEPQDLIAAEKIYKNLLKESPQAVNVIIQLGDLYEQAGLLEKAKQQYQVAEKLTKDNEKYTSLSKAISQFIENLNNGKLNTKHKPVSIKKEESNNQPENSNEEQPERATNANDIEKTPEQSSNIDKVTIAVDKEGPINVRSQGSLSGEKLTKITETGEFEKIDENDKWVLIIIPANDEHDEIQGWVHKKFVQ